LGEGGAERGIVDRHAVQADAFVVSEDMRRGIAADLVAGAVDDVLEVGAGRSLAVGAADDDHRAVLDLAKRRLDLADAFQAELDAGLTLRMQSLEMGQPVGESLQAAAGWLSSSASVRATWSRISRRSTIMSMAPLSSRNSARWKPSGN